MNLLALLHKSIVLGHALEGKLVHQIDLMRLGHKSILEVQDGHRERGRVHQDLPLLRQELDEVLNDRLELGAEKLVSLIHSNHVALLQVARILVGKVENTTWGSHHYMDLIVQTHNVLSKACAACWDHALDIHVFANFLHRWRRLQGQLSRRSKSSFYTQGLHTGIYINIFEIIIYRNYTL